MENIKNYTETFGNTKLIGIIGWPLEHSLSPAMHNISFQKLKLNYQYVPLSVKPQYLSQILERLKFFGFIGANVTAPYKIAIIPYIDILDESAKKANAVNTIIFINGSSVGYNTDTEGFMRVLHLKNIKVIGKHAVILGAGGVARAIIAGLIKNGINKISLYVRKRKNVQNMFNKTLINSENKKMIKFYEWGTTEFYNQIKTCEFIINATSLGMWPKIDECPPIMWDKLSSKILICDTVYNPLKTKFLQNALANGYKIIDGLEMLIEQGRLAFKLWTGEDMPKINMKKKLSKLIENL